MGAVTKLFAENPITALLALGIIAWAAVQPFYYAFLCWNRWMRSKNIRAHGWPTAPMDGDGDIVRKGADT